MPSLKGEAFDQFVVLGERSLPGSHAILGPVLEVVISNDHPSFDEGVDDALVDPDLVHDLA